MAALQYKGPCTNIEVNRPANFFLLTFSTPRAENSPGFANRKGQRMRRYEFTEDETEAMRRLIFHYQSARNSRHDVDLWARKSHTLANRARITLGIVYVKLDGGELVRVNPTGRPRTEPIERGHK